MIFWARQNYRDRERNRGGQGLRVRSERETAERQDEHSGERELCYILTVVLVTGLDTFVK